MAEQLHRSRKIRTSSLLLLLLLLLCKKASLEEELLDELVASSRKSFGGFSMQIVVLAKITKILHKKIVFLIVFEGVITALLLLSKAGRLTAAGGELFFL